MGQRRWVTVAGGDKAERVKNLKYPRGKKKKDVLSKLPQTYVNSVLDAEDKLDDLKVE